MGALGEKLTGAGEGLSVVIVGRTSLQNRLVAALIGEGLGCSVEVCEPDRASAARAALGAIVLLDVDGMTPPDIDCHARTLLAGSPFRGIAFINADEAKVAEIVDCPGVQGVFFRDTSRENLVRGIQAIFAGEYWLPRDVLSRHFARTRAHRLAVVPDSRVGLTPKETETLELLLGGHSNGAIAHRLGVSPHTVKTHLYNLFRKIGARNRVQAVNWAMRNIDRAQREHG